MAKKTKPVTTDQEVTEKEETPAINGTENGDSKEEGEESEKENGETTKEDDVEAEMTPVDKAKAMFMELPVPQKAAVVVGIVFVLFIVLSGLFSGSGTPVTGQIDESDKPEKSWGTYYDPKEIFCGKYDCYKILGFDHELWGREGPPDIKNITKNYRSLSRKWHPDKNPDRGAKERFVKIGRAYEVLTDRDKRKEYDFLRGRPDEYFKKYGTAVNFIYAPKSNSIFVIILLFAIGSAVSWWAQKHKWQTVADRLVKAAVEGLSTREGGTPESLELHEKAMKILKERQGVKPETTNATSNKKSSGAKATTTGGKQKMTKQEKAKKEIEELTPIVKELVNEMKDFGGGYHQPTWKDLMIVQMVKIPIEFYNFIMWEVNFQYRRYKRVEMTAEEKEVLTIRAIGNTMWLGCSEEERKEINELKVWEHPEKLEEFREQREFRQLSMTEQKKHKKAMKRAAGMKNE